MERTIFLAGLRGDNPLGYLAAIGILASLEDIYVNAKLSWSGLTPSLKLEQSMEETEAKVADEVGYRNMLIDVLYRSLRQGEDASSIVPGEKNLTFESRKIYDIAVKAAYEATFPARRTVDLIAAYGIPDSDPEEKMLPSNWVMLSGQGHQNFLENMANIIRGCNREHLESALFGSWEERDDGRNRSLRLDPSEDRRYALMDGDPADSKRKLETMIGANRLAIEALRFFPSFPVSGKGRLGVVAWKVGNVGKEQAKVRWPLWSCYAGGQIIKALLSQDLLWEVDKSADAREGLLKRGIFAVIEARRIKVENYRNITPGVPIWWHTGA